MKKVIHLDKKNHSLKLRYDYRGETYYLVVKNDYENELFCFTPLTKMIFDSRKEVEIESPSIELNKVGIYLFKK